LCQWNFPLT